MSTTINGTESRRVEWLVGGAMLLLFVLAVALFGVFPTLAVIVVAGLFRLLLRAGPLALVALLILSGVGCDS